MRAIHDLEQRFHHHQKGATPMSAVDKIKQFIDEHAPELETLLADAEHAAAAIDPALAPVLPLFGELADGAKALVADTIRALHNVPSTPDPTTPSTPGTSSSGAGSVNVPSAEPATAPLTADEQARLDALQARASA